MPSLEEKRNHLVVEIGGIPDPHERLGYLFRRGEKAEGLPAELKTTDTKIMGCMSELWLVSEYADGICKYRSDSEAMIVKGIADLLCDFYSQATPEDIVRTKADFLTEVGVIQHLSPNRRSGLSRIVEEIQAFAQKCRS